MIVDCQVRRFIVILGLLLVSVSGAIKADDDAPQELALDCEYLLHEAGSNKTLLKVIVNCQIASDPDPIPLDDDQPSLTSITGDQDRYSVVGPDDQPRVLSSLLARLGNALRLLPL